MKIVLDTTILVRANEHSAGLGRDLLMRVVGSEHQLLLSNEILYELARILRYPRIQTFLPEELVFGYISVLRSFSEIVSLDPLVVAPIRDVNDIAVMQTAIIDEADILCTDDGDFFASPANEYLTSMGIAVLSDIALMKLLRS